MVFEKLAHASKPILWISFLLGLVLSWSVLSGDNSGRVNLLYLIILYVIIPCFSLVYSLIFYFFKPFQLASLTSLIVFFIQNNNFLFTNYKQQYLKLSQGSSTKLVFFYFSQLAAMSFSVASLLILFILLITTDMHFIWRSTILNSEQILSVLQLIALPWEFWGDAQPSLELILNSQDNRLLQDKTNQLNVLTSSQISSSWWKFVLAVQLFYAFLLRLVVVILLKIKFKYKQKVMNSKTMKREQSHFSVLKKKEIENHLTLLQIQDFSAKNIEINYVINNWANLPLSFLSEIQSSLSGECVNTLNAGPAASDSERLIAERWRDTQLILVKSWEPPLAELSDFMQNSNGYILPIDVKKENVVATSEKHLREWFRFTDKHTQWELLLLPKLVGAALENTKLERTNLECKNLESIAINKKPNNK